MTQWPDGDGAREDASCVDTRDKYSTKYSASAYCDGCVPLNYVVNTTLTNRNQRLNTTMTGKFCNPDDISEGSSTSEAQDDWQFWFYDSGSADERGHYECRTGGVQGRACRCTVGCYWSSCSANDDYGFGGSCRCAMFQDRTQHYCFNSVMNCEVCPAGTYRANCGCTDTTQVGVLPGEPASDFNRKWKCRAGTCLPNPVDYYTPGPSVYPFPCPDGYSTLGRTGSTNCTTCWGPNVRRPWCWYAEVCMLNQLSLCCLLGRFIAATGST